MGFGKNQPETAAAEASDRRDVSDVSHWDFVEIFSSDVRTHCFALCVSFLSAFFDNHDSSFLRLLITVKK